MMFDDDEDFFAVPQKPDDEPPDEDEDSMHEAIEPYLRKRGFNFIGKDGPRRSAARTASHGVNSPNVSDEPAPLIHAVPVGSTPPASVSSPSDFRQIPATQRAAAMCQQLSLGA